MAPSTAMISAASGTKDVTIRKITSAIEVSSTSSFGIFGASAGFTQARPTT